jgi:hypothetical protein
VLLHSTRGYCWEAVIYWQVPSLHLAGTLPCVDLESSICRPGSADSWHRTGLPQLTCRYLQHCLFHQACGRLSTFAIKALEAISSFTELGVVPDFVSTLTCLPPRDVHMCGFRQCCRCSTTVANTWDTRMRSAHLIRQAYPCTLPGNASACNHSGD